MGTLELDLPGGLPTLTGRLVELLGTDATIRAVLFDGHRPLAVTAKLHAQDIPTDTRLAVTACVGAAWHLRHVHPQHTDGWDGHLDPATGAITWTRRDRIITRLPHGTPLPPPAANSSRDDPPGDPHGGDPPGDGPPSTGPVRPSGAARAADAGPPLPF